MSIQQRVHNKSGRSEINVATVADQEFQTWVHVLATTMHRADKNQTEVQGLCYSPCLIYPAGDGRVTVDRRKVAYAYQIMARAILGQEALQQVEASKTAESLVISHLCGTRNCMQVSHMVLETKRVNDERTHCHFCMRKSNVRPFIYCAHNPACGSEVRYDTL